MERIFEMEDEMMRYTTSSTEYHPEPKTSFSSLPFEIRDLIWMQAIAGASPRLVDLSHTISSSSSNFTGLFYSRTPVPALLHTCHRSRTLALKRWKTIKIRQPSIEHTKYRRKVSISLFLAPQMDTLYLDSSTLLSLSTICTSKSHQRFSSFSSFSSITNILLDISPAPPSLYPQQTIPIPTPNPFNEGNHLASSIYTIFPSLQALSFVVSSTCIEAAAAEFFLLRKPDSGDKEGRVRWWFFAAARRMWGDEREVEVRFVKRRGIENAILERDRGWTREDKWGEGEARLCIPTVGIDC